VGASKNGDNEDVLQNGNSFLDKDLDAALDSFDNLFCRRCLVSIVLVLHSIHAVLCFHPIYNSVDFFFFFLFFLKVFDCRLHGCSQDLIFPVSLYV
jgi:histone-lysine N-methyltransferase EZH2